MNPISQPFEYQAAAMRLAGYILTNNLRIMQIMTCSVLDAPMAQVRALRIASSRPSSQARTIEAAGAVKPETVAAAIPGEDSDDTKTKVVGSRPRVRSKQSAPAKKTRADSRVAARKVNPKRAQAPKPGQSSKTVTPASKTPGAATPNSETDGTKSAQPTAPKQAPVQPTSVTAPALQASESKKQEASPKPLPSGIEAKTSPIGTKTKSPDQVLKTTAANKADATAAPAAPLVSSPKPAPARTAPDNKAAAKPAGGRTRSPSQPPAMPDRKPKSDR